MPCPVFFRFWNIIIEKIFKTSIPKISVVGFDEIFKGLEVDRSGWGVEPVKIFTPGTIAGLRNLEEFVEKRIKAYGAKRNDPNVSALSNLSPWVNMGQVSCWGYDSGGGGGDGLSVHIK